MRRRKGEDERKEGRGGCGELRTGYKQEISFVREYWVKGVYGAVKKGREG